MTTLFEGRSFRSNFACISVRNAASSIPTARTIITLRPQVLDWYHPNAKEQRSIGGYGGLFEVYANPALRNPLAQTKFTIQPGRAFAPMLADKMDFTGACCCFWGRTLGCVLSITKSAIDSKLIQLYHHVSDSIRPGPAHSFTSEWADLFVERKLDGERILAHWSRTGFRDPKEDAGPQPMTSSGAAANSSSSSGSFVVGGVQLLMYFRGKGDAKTYQQVRTIDSSASRCSPLICRR